MTTYSYGEAPNNDAIFAFQKMQNGDQAMRLTIEMRCKDMYNQSHHQDATRAQIQEMIKQMVRKLEDINTAIEMEKMLNGSDTGVKIFRPDFSHASKMANSDFL